MRPPYISDRVGRIGWGSAFYEIPRSPVLPVCRWAIGPCRPQTGWNILIVIIVLCCSGWIGCFVAVFWVCCWDRIWNKFYERCCLQHVINFKVVINKTPDTTITQPQSFPSSTSGTLSHPSMHPCYNSHLSPQTLQHFLLPNTPVPLGPPVPPGPGPRHNKLQMGSVGGLGWRPGKGKG